MAENKIQRDKNGALYFIKTYKNDFTDTKGKVLQNYCKQNKASFLLCKGLYYELAKLSLETCQEVDVSIDDLYIYNEFDDFKWGDYIAMLIDRGDDSIISNNHLNQALECLEKAKYITIESNKLFLINSNRFLYHDNRYSKKYRESMDGLKQSFVDLGLNTEQVNAITNKFTSKKIQETIYKELNDIISKHGESVIDTMVNSIINAKDEIDLTKAFSLFN